MKLIILDRDGVINEDSADYIKSPEEWHAIPSSLAAIAQLKQAGYTVVVASNQSGISRGYYDEAMLEQIHQKMQVELATYGAHIDKIFFCPHGPDDHCECRKPKPGLFKQIAAYYQTDLQHVPAIGDSLRDIKAAEAVKCKAILVKTGNGQVTAGKINAAIPVYDNLAAAVDSLLHGII